MNREQNRAKHSPENSQLESLFSHAKARPKPPADAEQRIRQAVEVEWSQMIGRKRNRRKNFAIAIAASVVLAALIGSQFMKPSATAMAAPVAVAEKVSGAAQRLEGAIAQPLNSMDPIRAGQTLVTGFDSRLGLAWAGGASVRLNAGSRIEIISSSEFELLEGQVYVDIHPGVHGGLPLNMRTRQGIIRHLGTQYMAESKATTLILSVREGAIELADADQLAAAVLASGEQLLLTSGQPAARRSIDIHDDSWRWTETVAPGFDMEGRQLSDFIAWAARQTGRTLHYADSSAERAAEDTIMHGEIDLPPSRALGVVLQTTDLEADESGESIIIRQRG